MAKLPNSFGTLIVISNTGTCNTVGLPTKETVVQVYEIFRDSTFRELFGSFGIPIDSLVLTQAQIKQFATLYPNWLKKGGNGTFFLFMVGTEFFVSAVYFFSDGRLGVRVRRLTLERVLRAQKRHRLVVKLRQQAGHCGQTRIR